MCCCAPNEARRSQRRRMRIAFYAPLKPPDHPVASGDRAMARALIAALETRRPRGGDRLALPQLRCRRSRRGRQRLRDGRRSALAERLLRRFERGAARPTSGSPTTSTTRRPTGSARASRRGSASPTSSPKPPSRRSRRAGAGTSAIARSRTRSAAPTCIFQPNPADAECVLPLLDEPGAAGAAAAVPRHRAVPRARPRPKAAPPSPRLLGLDPGEPWLLTVAMMRDDQKLLSYRCLAEALSPARRPALAAASSRARARRRRRCATLSRRFGDRVRWIGMLDAGRRCGSSIAPPTSMSGRRSRRPRAWRCWRRRPPGLPVVAGRSGGVPAVVADGETGLLAPEGDAAAFAAAVRALLADPRAARRRWARPHASAPRATTTSPARRRFSTAHLRALVAARRDDPAPRHPPRARPTGTRAGCIQGRADRPLDAGGPRRGERLAPAAGMGGRRLPVEPARAAPWRPRRCSASSPTPEPRLIEMDWGEWEGRTLADLRAELGAAMARERGARPRFPPARRREPARRAGAAAAARSRALRAPDDRS